MYSILSVVKMLRFNTVINDMDVSFFYTCMHMSSDIELNWMTSPKYFRVIQTHLTCLNGTATCFTTVWLTHCGCVRWECNIENNSKEM